MLIVYDEKHESDWQCDKTDFASDEVKIVS